MEITNTIVIILRFVSVSNYHILYLKLTQYVNSISINLEKMQSGKKLEQNKYEYGFPGGSDSKVSACNAGDPGSIPGLGRSPGEGNGNPLQHSCLENPMDGGA